MLKSSRLDTAALTLPNKKLTLKVQSLQRVLHLSAFGLLFCLLSAGQNFSRAQTAAPEYLWYEAENMRGISRSAGGEPVQNPSWTDLPRAQNPGWAINGPGVSAEWSQGGESEWNSVAASADETRARLEQDIEVSRGGTYKLWVRYADWVGRTEDFTARIMQGGREIMRHEFGVRDLVDAHDETAMYWGWAFVWGAGDAVTLSKGPAQIILEIERAAGARRHVDCVLLTNDPNFIPEGRQKPDFAALKYLREAAAANALKTVEPFTDKSVGETPVAWRVPRLAGRDFLMPWNIAREFWTLYEKPTAERPLYAFNAEPVEEFVRKYSGQKDVPIFASKLVVPVIYINDLPVYLKEGSPFLRYLRETHAPFAVVINYGTAQMNEADGQAAWKLLTGELRGQFLGWISGESVGHVWADVAAHIKRDPMMPRAELLENYHTAYSAAMERKWNALFHAPTGPMWDELIPAQATSSTSFAHALGEWGVKIIGIETAAVQPATAMRLAFTRGAARQYGASVFYYHAPNFGDTATTFTKQQNFAGPDFFYHSRYGPSMGPSLAWYRKSYYLYFMGGASAIHLEQGFDQFFKPGPGEHEFGLNPLGRITDEFMRFAEKHAADRGTPYTPIAFLLDPAHGWEMTDYPHWPFGVSPINRSDRALRELFGAAYYPLPVKEGEAATADTQAFINSVFGDIFDVLVASETHAKAIDNYRALVVGGRVRRWSPLWAAKLEQYVRAGGTLFLNAAQAEGLSENLLGIHRTGETREADAARCLLPGEANTDLRGQVFRYERISKLQNPATQILLETLDGDALATMHRLGRGRIIYCALPDLLGLDERFTPLAAHLFAHLGARAVPVEVNGDVEYSLNRNERGWVVTLFNNRGVIKYQQGLAQVDHRETMNVSINMRGKSIVSAREWMSDSKVEVKHMLGQADQVQIKLPAGDVAVVELTER